MNNAHLHLYKSMYEIFQIHVVPITAQSETSCFLIETTAELDFYSFLSSRKVVLYLKIFPQINDNLILEINFDGYKYFTWQQSTLEMLPRALSLNK